MSSNLHEEILFLVFSLTVVGQSAPNLFSLHERCKRFRSAVFWQGQLYRGIYISGAPVVYFLT